MKKFSILYNVHTTVQYAVCTIFFSTAACTCSALSSSVKFTKVPLQTDWHTALLTKTHFCFLLFFYFCDMRNNMQQNIKNKYRPQGAYYHVTQQPCMKCFETVFNCALTGLGVVIFKVKQKTGKIKIPLFLSCAEKKYWMKTKKKFWFWVLRKVRTLLSE